MPKLLLIGSQGMLGSDLLKAVLGRGWSLDSPWANDFDVSNPQHLEKIRRRNVGPYTHIVNCAAYTAVDKAEGEAMAAMRVNAVAPGALAYVARESGAKLLHISTDFVFDGFAQTPYKETDPTNPLSVYGKSKLQGEQNVFKENDRAVVLRTSWLYGSNGNCFPATMIRKCLEGVDLRVVDDQRGCPTSTVDLAESICQVVELDIAPGLYHCCGPEAVTWFQFAQRAIDTYRAAHPGIEPVPLSPCTTADYPAAARRPAFSVLDCSKIEAAGIAGHRALNESLIEFCARFKP